MMLLLIIKKRPLIVMYRNMILVIKKSFVIFFVLFLAFPYYSFAKSFTISEVMFNPNGDENVREFVEILNLSEKDLSLEGFLIGDGTGFDTIIPTRESAWTVPKGSYALILDPDYFTADEPYEEIPAGTPLFTVDDNAIGNRGLSNSTAEHVYLISCEGDTLSVVAYSLECMPGHSWEKIIPYGNDSMDNFQQSKKAEGTPGQKNSVTPPQQNPALDKGSIRFSPPQPHMNDELEVIISYRNAGLKPISDIKVMVWILPNIEVGSAGFPEEVKPGEISDETSLFIDALPGGRLSFTVAVVQNGNSLSTEDDTVTVMLDVTVPIDTIFLNEVMAAPKNGETEWIEVYNQGDSPVNLFDWNIVDSTGKSKGLVCEHSFVSGNGYAVISGGHLIYDVSEISPLVIVDGFPALNNDGDVIKLFDFTGVLIDSMLYEDAPSGYSFELISTEMSGTVSGWDKCVDPSGETPGTLNSIHYSNVSVENVKKNKTIELSVSPNPFPDVITISYSLPFPLARIRLYVYDRRGRLVAKIRDTEESGSEWIGSWDGRNNGARLSAGPYILNLEALNKHTGKVYIERKTIVIARKL